MFDLFWGFDARKIHPKSRDLTAFMTPLGLLQITSLPTGFTNSPAEFQKCMVMVLQDEIPHTANIFIDDLPIKGPATQYLDKEGKPELILGYNDLSGNMHKMYIVYYTDCTVPEPPSPQRKPRYATQKL